MTHSILVVLVLFLKFSGPFPFFVRPRQWLDAITCLSGFDVCGQRALDIEVKHLVTTKLASVRRRRCTSLSFRDKISLRSRVVEAT